MIATAVAWRTAVALGNDLDARPFCVDKLLKLAAKNGIEIDGSTTIVVDEAGMLSTRQAHHVLRLAERHGAKGGVRGRHPPAAAGGGGAGLAADPRCCRQRPRRPHPAPEAGPRGHPGPCARRDAVGGALPGRADGGRRARRILADYEAMAEKPAFTPWQVKVSEALRDGDAETAIEAWHERGRLHLGYGEERTLTALVDEWDRYTTGSTRRRAPWCWRAPVPEVRALSHLMREKRFARQNVEDVKRVTVTVSRGDGGRPDGIATGDRRRRPASHRRHALGEAALQRHRGHGGGFARSNGTGPGRRREVRKPEGPEPGGQPGLTNPRF